MTFDLEERLISYAVLILEIVGSLPDNRACNHLGGQLIRSGTAPALLYGEAQGAESRKDFIHKIKIVLKELRESLVTLKIIDRMNYLKDRSKLERAVKESNELISIFVKSVETARKNLSKTTS